MRALTINEVRKAPPSASSVIDGVSRNIENQFARVYERLYNSIDDHDNLMEVFQHLNERINYSSMIDV